MPRKARLDTPGTLHHVVIRGFEGRAIFWEEEDRGDFLSRVVQLVEKSGDRIVAWTLTPQRQQGSCIGNREEKGGVHPDLQVKGYLKGNEEVELLNLTPEGIVLLQVPGIGAVCTATKSFDSQAGGNGPLDREEVSLNLDPLCLIPEARRLFQIWRGI